MKAIISSTFDDKYLFFLPITTYCWNKIGVDVVCFLPEYRERLFSSATAPSGDFKKYNESDNDIKRLSLISKLIRNGTIKFYTVCFSSPEHKQATYAQCLRLYGAALDLPEDEILITGDVDMAVFGEYLKHKQADFDIFGSDLTPEKQVPICYISASVKNWRIAMGINGRSYQECIDDLLGGIEAEHFRGNYWGKDQEEAYNKISSAPLSIHHHFRARAGTQFASRRLDRDDAYILQRLNPDIIDYHMNRPGYEENNFQIILTVLKYMYPNDDFQWLVDYQQEYIKLL